MRQLRHRSSKSTDYYRDVSGGSCLELLFIETKKQASPPEGNAWDPI